MLSQFAFSKDTIESFERKYKIYPSIPNEQRMILEDTGFTQLTHDQLIQLGESLAKDGSLHAVLRGLKPASPMLSVTVYVVNPATWKIMEKRETHKDRMLPMFTFPWFFWSEESRNKWGVKRNDVTDTELEFDRNNNEITISGNGGDFCGFVALSAVKQDHSLWHLFIPEMPTSSERIPRYDNQIIQLGIDAENLELQLYPKPLPEFDYTYSESPKVFYNHGIAIKTVGKNTTYQIGRRKASGLSGDVTVLIGRSHNENAASETVLEYHIWLNILYFLLNRQ